MKTKFFGLICFFVLFIFLTPGSSLACSLEEDNALARCNLRPRPSASQVLVSSAAPTSVAKIPSGASPSEARDVPNEWQALEPRASIWFKTDYSDNFRLLEYWLETNRPDVASLAIYAPQQSDGLSAATRPVGRGTHSKNDPDNLIRWKAGYAWPGVWYVLLTNNTDQPISFKLNHNQETVPVKNCISYWETVQGVLTYWTDCGLHTGPH